MTESILSSDLADLSRVGHSARSPRPILSRVADAVYWMSRYIERCEHVSRVLLVNADLLTDIGDMTPELREQLWKSSLRMTDINAELRPEEAGKDIDEIVPGYMTFGSENPSSLLSCLTKARENARSVRENISAEMWQNINTLYWTIQSEEARHRFAESPPEIYREVIHGSLMFQGLTDQMMQHGQPWLFAQVGKYLERVDMTCRILETKYQILRSAESKLEAPLRNIHWMAVLRSCGSIEAYRRMYVGDMDPVRVAAFIVFEPSFPRAIRYAVSHAQSAAARIRELSNPSSVDAADRILGRLNADLEYADASTIIRTGLPAFLQNIRHTVGQAALATKKAYFLA